MKDKIKVLMVCHGRIRTFVWSGLKSRLLGNENGICTPIVPLFCASVPRQPKSKAFGLEFVNRTVLDKNEYDLWWKKFLRGGEKCWQIVLQKGIPFEMKLPRTAPLTYGSLTKEQFDKEIEKGMSDVKAGRVHSADAIEAEMKRDFGIWFFMWHIPLKQDRIWGTFMNILRMNCWYLRQLPDNGCIVRNDRK